MQEKIDILNNANIRLKCVFDKNNPDEFIKKHSHIFDIFGDCYVDYVKTEDQICKYILDDYDGVPMYVHETIVFFIEHKRIRKYLGIKNCFTYVSKDEFKRHGGEAKFFKLNYHKPKFLEMEPTTTFKEKK